ncbi:hypothetical protein HDU82_003377 [Entophlyctis luteolus]|nr:hypothetical protein HDU82_003377 [Entophlyctis luteolus]
MSKCNGLVIEDATIAQVNDWFENGNLTSVQLVQCYLDRIAQIDDYVGAIMELNPDSLDIAAQMDAERSQGIVRGPLHGIPFIVKDNIATDDKVPTTAGTVSELTTTCSNPSEVDYFPLSAVLLGSKVPRDAYVVAKLRAAGAVILGHGNMSEWADMRSTSYSEGYSARRGQTRNAFNLTQEPGGSSTGPGVAVTTNMVMFALGTETDGSIVSPAERESLIGLKREKFGKVTLVLLKLQMIATVGLTSRAGVIPESSNQDTVGILARSLADAAIVLSIIHGVDGRDNATYAQIGKAHDDYTQFVTNSSALKGAKFGLPWARVWEAASTANQLDQLLEVLSLLEAAGATIYNNTDYPSYLTSVSPNGWDWKYPEENPEEAPFTYIAVDFYNNVQEYLSELSNTSIRTLEDIVNYNFKYSSVEGGYPGDVPAFASGQDNLVYSLSTGGAMNETYYAALDFCRRTSRAEGIDAALKYTAPDGTVIQLDALLTPSDDSGPASEMPAKAGYPLVTIPVGVDAWHVPFGITVLGTAFSEPALIKYGSAIDDLLKRRVKPTFYDYDANNIPVNWAYGTY